MNSSTGSAPWRIERRQQDVIRGQLVSKFCRELDTEPRQLSIVYNAPLKVRLQSYYRSTINVVCQTFARLDYGVK